MLKLLIVSPHFPPNNTPDMQRVRMMLPFLAQNEIEAIILAVKSDFTEAPLDNYILKSVPEHIVVKRVKACKSEFSRKIGLGNLGIRAFKYLRKEGEKIIKEFKPDLIFFSTTVFACMPLGRIWKKKV